MKKILTATLVVLVIVTGSAAQTNLVPPGKQINTTDPPNLSWVVGEFEVIKVDKGEAILAPIGQKTLPRTITVRYQKELRKQYPGFEPTQKLILVIREGWVSQVFTK